MALIKCPECGAEISSTAAACVKCGAPVSKAPKTTKGKGCFAAGCLTVFAGAIVLGAIGSMSNKQSTSSTDSTQTSLQGIKEACDPKTNAAQRAAAQSMIQLLGYDCAKLDTMCPYVFSDGYTVYCNDLRYKFELENHGGKWLVKAD